MTSVVELEQTCDWNVNLSCWWSRSELSNTELHRKHKSRKGPGSKFTDFMTTVFSSWNSKACHGQFVGNPRCWSSSGWSATTPWGSTSPSPSSRWTQSLGKITWKKYLQMSESKTTPLWPLHNYSPISWNTEDRALVLSAFFYGYIAFQVLHCLFLENFLDILLRCRAVEWPRSMGLRKCLAIGLQTLQLTWLNPNCPSACCWLVFLESSPPWLPTPTSGPSLLSASPRSSKSSWSLWLSEPYVLSITMVSDHWSQGSSWPRSSHSHHGHCLQLGDQ